MAPTLLPITFTFISVLAICLMPLTAWIGLYRGKTRILRGDGGDAVLFKRIRVHGNLMENAPLFALVLGASETLGLGATWLWLAVASFLAGRVLHYVLYDRKTRGVAMSLTLLPGLLMGVWLLVQLQSQV